jgi:nucleotide-binding universal stress UspA family protein
MAPRPAAEMLWAMSILICYDDSASARRAVTVARRTLAHHPPILLHVYHAPEAVLADAFSTRSSDPTTGPVSQDRLESLAARRAREVLDGAKAIVSDLGGDAQMEAREAAPDASVWETILTVADEIDAELIVTGTRGSTAEADEPLGSVSAGLLHHSRRPVLVVPAGR